MSSFSDSNFVKKLTELNGTQQSIQTLSLWLIHHRKHSKTIVQVWLRELKKVTPSRRLIYIYLANDVIQNSKKKGPEFAKDFGSVISEAFVYGYKSAADKQKNSLDRILKIWEERGVYSKEFVKGVKQAMAAGSSSSGGSGGVVSAKTTAQSIAEVLSEPTPKKRRKKDEPTDQVSLRQEIESLKPEELHTGPVDTEAFTKMFLQTESLIKRLSALENSASCDAGVREKIAALPPEVSDISQLAKLHDKDSARQLSETVNSACVLLTDYNKRLTEELDERKNVAKSLRAFILSQTDMLQHTEKRLLEYKNKLAKVKMVRNELKSHIQNLPDIGRPIMSGSLAPLPAVHDLFH